MRLLFAITIICFSPTSIIAQDNVDLNEMVGFACYFEGSPTKTVIKVEKLLKSRNYKALSKLMMSGHNGERFLAIISLQRLTTLGRYDLSLTESDLIEKAKQSDEMVSVCSGCTYFAKVPMKAILANDDFIWSGYWLERLIVE